MEFALGNFLNFNFNNTFIVLYLFKTFKIFVFRRKKRKKAKIKMKRLFHKQWERYATIFLVIVFKFKHLRCS